jgi:hypothetical protein
LTAKDFEWQNIIMHLLFWCCCFLVFFVTIVVGSRQTVFNVDDFGADPSGTNDSFPAFFAAIQQATKGESLIYETCSSKV